MGLLSFVFRDVPEAVLSIPRKAIDCIHDTNDEVSNFFDDLGDTINGRDGREKISIKRKENE